MEIQEKALPLHPVISFSVINYVVSMRGPHVSGDNLFFYALQPASELVQASACLSLIHALDNAAHTCHGNRSIP